MDIAREKWIDEYIMHLRSLEGLREGDFSDAIGLTYREHGEFVYYNYIQAGCNLTPEQCAIQTNKEWNECI